MFSPGPNSQLFNVAHKNQLVHDVTHMMPRVDSRYILGRINLIEYGHVHCGGAILPMHLLTVLGAMSSYMVEFTEV